MPSFQEAQHGRQTGRKGPVAGASGLGYVSREPRDLLSALVDSDWGRADN